VTPLIVGVATIEPVLEMGLAPKIAANRKDEKAINKKRRI
jgi:hypothetical protein